MPIRRRAAKADHPHSIMITGASSGIGEALALYYAAPGVTLFLSGRNDERLRAAAEACRQRGAMVEAQIVDVSQQGAMQDWINFANQKAPLDLVIANAGISGGTGDGGEDAAQVRQIFDVNVNGVLNTVLPCLPLMMARGRGQIALMSSLASFSGWPGAPAYGASKGAVRLYGEGLRGAVAGSGVRINVICPGFVESRMTAVNDYAMPFLIDSPKAARIIARGLLQNRGRVAFPWPSYAIAVFVTLLPRGLADKILANLPRKPAMLKDNTSA